MIDYGKESSEFYEKAAHLGRQKLDGGYALLQPSDVRWSVNDNCVCNEITRGIFPIIRGISLFFWRFRFF